MPRQINKLNSITIANLKDRGLYSDGNGLWLQVSESGTKAWIFRYDRFGKRHLMGLGSLKNVNLASARERAKEANRLLLDGRDPLEIKHAIIEQAKLELLRNRTFKQCADEYLSTMLNELKNDKHRKQWRSTLEETFPTIGMLPIGSIETDHIISTLTPIWERAPETADRLRSRIEKVLAWATVRNYRSGDNPARWVNHLDTVFTRKKKKDNHQALPYAEAPAFMAALRAKHSVSARALEFTILTAARTGETIGAKWSEIDLKAKTWTVPAERMKAGQEHVVPLSDRALEILKSQSRTTGHIFINGGGRPLSNMAMLVLLKAMRPGLTTHGCRSTFRDWAGDKTEHTYETIEFAIAHKIPDKAAASYRRYKALEKRRALMAEWAAFCGSY